MEGGIWQSRQRTRTGGTAGDKTRRSQSVQSRRDIEVFNMSGKRIDGVDAVSFGANARVYRYRDFLVQSIESGGVSEVTAFDRVYEL